MRTIKIESCKKCPFRKEILIRSSLALGRDDKDWVHDQGCFVNGYEKAERIDKRVKTFPRFCPLENTQ